MKIQWNFRYNLIRVNQKKHKYVFQKIFKMYSNYIQKNSGPHVKLCFLEDLVTLVTWTNRSDSRPSATAWRSAEIGAMHRIALMSAYQGSNQKETHLPPKPPQKNVKMFVQAKKTWFEFIQCPVAWIFSSKVQSQSAAARGQKLITSEFSRRQSSRRLKNHHPPTSSYHIINLLHLRFVPLLFPRQKYIKTRPNNSKSTL